MRSFFVAVCFVIFVAGCDDKKTEPAKSEADKAQEEANKLEAANKKLADELEKHKKLLSEQAVTHKAKQDALTEIAKEKEKKALIRIEAEKKISEIQAESKKRVADAKTEMNRKVSELQKEIRDLRTLYFMEKNPGKRKEIMTESDNRTQQMNLLLSDTEEKIKKEEAATAAQIKEIRLKAGIVGFFP